MKFRTEIEIAPLGTKIGYENRILALGSCFAEHIAGRLAQAKFRVTANPSGILFNPLSIAAALRSYAGEKPVRHSELGFDGELWFHYGFHGSFSAPEADQALAAMNAARKSGAEALRAADRIVLTFGTAWVYEHDGAVVANCHRRPAAEFTRGRDRHRFRRPHGRSARRQGGDPYGQPRAASRRLTGGQRREQSRTPSGRRRAGGAFSRRSLFPRIRNPQRRPARLPVLRRRSGASVSAGRGIRLSEQARRLLPDVRHIVVAAAHRPRNPQSATYREFCRRRLEEIAALPQIDFRTEAEYFRRCIEINS